MSVFENLTPKTRKAINYAFEEARLLNFKYIGVEHLLLGLLRVTDGRASELLTEWQVTTEATRYQVVKMCGKGSFSTNISGYTPRALACLDRSYALALRDNSKEIRTEHLLLSILKDRASYGVKALLNQKVAIEILESTIERKQKKQDAKPVEEAKEKTALEMFSLDLTNLAEDKLLDPVIGREKEIQRVLQILSRRTKNNPCLIGEAGVGKTAVIEGLAIRIVDKKVPTALLGKRILSLNMGAVVAGTKYRGEFEDRFNKILEELMDREDIILFIDELHSIIGAGGSEGAIDASSILKPSLARGAIQVIGATTTKEYHKFIEKDSGLERRFQPILIHPPTAEESVRILTGLRPRYEEHHGVVISDEAIHSAVELSARYIVDRFLPDKAVDLIDEASSKLRMNHFVDFSALELLEKRLIEVQESKQIAINQMAFESAASLRDEERSLIELIEEEKEKCRLMEMEHPRVLSHHIEEVVSIWTGIPVTKLVASEHERLQNIEKIIGNRVIGQYEAIKVLAKSVKRGRIGLSNPNKPIGSYIFVGPTGVGKTELCKALAEAVFGDEKNLVRFDMSEYMEKHAISKLIGSPPGYVGYEEEGLLAKRLRKNPYSVILFDEIEKAHVDIYDILLQILDEGGFTDAKGHLVNFKNAIIIMTSNIGVVKISKPMTLGFVEKTADESYENMRTILLEEVKNYFRPEFINRIDDIVVFNQLSKVDVESIARLLLEEFSERLARLGYEFVINEDVIDYLVANGYDITYGARPIKRMIVTHIEDYITDLIIEEKVSEAVPIELMEKDGKLRIKEV
ncbi:MAG: ATP-dependent Clp protease ATP-binding subunit [Clostridia bacterium]|nr:ATP-dependent Clp protease ATP-binding subunit [Clostridia bacterium]